MINLKKASYDSKINSLITVNLKLLDRFSVSVEHFYFLYKSICVNNYNLYSHETN